tara:strand:- start:158 stop:361 length:204 start_codon:yes stop_codon:yes gene_type:complete
MKRNSVLKKFDSEIEALYDVLDKIKDILESTEDYELSETVAQFYDQMTDSMQEGEVNIEGIRDQIVG